MPKEAITFDNFLMEVSPGHLDFTRETHDFLLKSGCAYKIEAAKSGYVLSYMLPKTKKVVLNYVFRKNKMIVRIYGDNIGKYTEIFNTFPENMIKAIEKAPVCKRLIDPEKCNSRCPMGNIFELGGKTYKNCRYGSFMFEIMNENFPAIKNFIERELNERLSG